MTSKNVIETGLGSGADQEHEVRMLHAVIAVKKQDRNSLPVANSICTAVGLGDFSPVVRETLRETEHRKKEKGEVFVELIRREDTLGDFESFLAVFDAVLEDFNSSEIVTNIAREIAANRRLEREI